MDIPATTIDMEADDPTNNTLYSPDDVRAVRTVLRDLGLPTELVLVIVDLADYHASIRAAGNDAVAISTWKGVANCAAQLYLISPPLPGRADFRKAKKVVWLVDGHDQGWGGEAPGQYAPAYSWYDACILRQTILDARAPPSAPPSATRSSQAPQPDVTHHPMFYRLHRDPESMERDVLAPEGWAFVRNGESCVWRLQSNRIALGQYERHVVEWAAGRKVDEEATRQGAWDGAGFVETLRAGDRVGIWMRALYPGWENFLKEAAVQVMYEVE